MRDPKRIDLVLDVIAVYWKQHPDLRLGQLLYNASAVNNFPPAKSTYDMEEDELLAGLSKLDRMERKND